VILPEAKELAKVYPISEEQINEYLLTGLTVAQVASVCAYRLAANKGHMETLYFVQAVLWMKEADSE
jgi:hypothetical protein